MATKKLTQCESIAKPMIIKIEGFQTSDSVIFKNEKEALEHEKNIVRIDLVRNLVDKDEFCDLPLDLKNDALFVDFIINNGEALLEILK